MTNVKRTLWPVALLALLGLLVMAGSSWAEPGDEGATVVAQDVTPTPTPVRSYLPWVPNDATPTPIPTPTPTPTPTPLPNWTGQYFNNVDLSGSPALVRSDTQIDFDWNEASPSPGILADGFSARWTRTLDFPAGAYSFYTYTDDGVRLWIDNQIGIDDWRDGSPRQNRSDQTLAAGGHSVRMDYYERTARAAARLGIVNRTAYPQPERWEWGTWKGEYFDNPSLSGDPRMVRQDNKIDFEWGNGSPDLSIPADNFSVRWTASLFLRAGDYNFFTYTDDGVRLYVDGALVINEWHDQGPTQWRSSIPLAEGFHFIRVEYFELGSGATARLWWHNSGEFPAWRGEYFTNVSLSGSPTVIRNDNSIDFEWPGAPADGLPHDGFSVRWTGILDLEAGDYTFRAIVDDGVRLWVDGVQGLNEWRDQGPTDGWISILPLSGGLHFIRMEYYQGSFGATARLNWSRN